MRTLALILVCAAPSLPGCAGVTATPPIVRAAAGGQDAEVNSLLSQGASIDDYSASGCGLYPSYARHSGDETPLICAVINGRLDTVKLLLIKGANINAQDFGGRTALDYASSGPSANAAIAAVLHAKLEGRVIEPAAPPAPVPEPKPVAEKQWWDK